MFHVTQVIYSWKIGIFTRTAVRARFNWYTSFLNVWFLFSFFPFSLLSPQTLAMIHHETHRFAKKYVMQIAEGAARTDLLSDLVYSEGWPFSARGTFSYFPERANTRGILLQRRETPTGRRTYEHSAARATRGIGRLNFGRRPCLRFWIRL